MKKNRIIAFIPAAGLGARLYPITKVIPKEMFPIGNKPLIHYLIEHLTKSGLRDILIATRPQKYAIKEYLKDGHSFGARIRYVHGSPIGIDHTLRAAQRHLKGRSFLLAVGDLFIENSSLFQELIAHYERYGVSVDTLMRDTKKELVSFAIPVIEKTPTGLQRITSYRARQSSDHAPLVSLGISILPPTFFSYFPQKTKREIPLGNLINTFMRHENRLGFITKSRVYDCSKPEGFIQATRYIIQK